MFTVACQTRGSVRLTQAYLQLRVVSKPGEEIVQAALAQLSHHLHVRHVDQLGGVTTGVGPCYADNIEAVGCLLFDAHVMIFVRHAMEMTDEVASGSHIYVRHVGQNKAGNSEGSRACRQLFA